MLVLLEHTETLPRIYVILVIQFARHVQGQQIVHAQNAKQDTFWTTRPAKPAVRQARALIHMGFVHQPSEWLLLH